MKISALEEYGTRCMLRLAEVEDGTYLTLPEIAELEKLSVPYAGKLLMLLRQAGLVHAERGRNGGYSLTRTPGEISLKDIFDAMGEPLYNKDHCNRYSGENDTCIHLRDCTVRGVWRKVSDFISSYISMISLADLIKNDLPVPPEVVDTRKTGFAIEAD